MNPKTEQDIIEILTAVWREIAYLRAGDTAWTRVITDLLTEGHITIEVIEVLRRHREYREEERTAVLLRLEEQFPFLAAQLDRGHNEPPPSHETDEADPK